MQATTSLSRHCSWRTRRRSGRPRCVLRDEDITDQHDHSRCDEERTAASAVDKTCPYHAHNQVPELLFLAGKKLMERSIADGISALAVWCHTTYPLSSMMKSGRRPARSTRHAPITLIIRFQSWRKPFMSVWSLGPYCSLREKN
jgi:hypothetical protein